MITHEKDDSFYSVDCHICKIVGKIVLPDKYTGMDVFMADRLLQDNGWTCIQYNSKDRGILFKWFCKDCFDVIVKYRKNDN
jgi:hypothetical protein